jgi:two-component system, OmpR family, response regulator
MHPEDIYAPTPLGETELRGSATRLTTAQIDVLVRLDGILTVDQLSAGMNPAQRAAFTEVLGGLRSDRLIHRLEPDPFTLQWNADVAQLTRAVGQADVDAGLSSLKRAGFYVQIARGRGTARQAPSAGRPPVIVVEDDAALASFISTLLSLSGFDVRQAGTREQVVTQIRRQPIPALILLDVVLPDADGFDILQRVRQHPQLKDVPVIMLTGKATREAVLKGMTGGADGYITKPFEPEALLRAIRTVLGLPEPPAGAAWQMP